jgi:hypothetical protein
LLAVVLERHLVQVAVLVQVVIEHRLEQLAVGGRLSQV